MNVFFPVLGAGIVLAILAIILLISGRHGKGSPLPKMRGAELRELEKRLAQNPRDSEAMKRAGTLYYQAQDWEKALRIYESLSNMTLEQEDKYTANLRCGVCSLKLGKKNEAYGSFVTARGFNPNDYEASFNLGVLEFEKRNFEKALQFLRQARLKNPNHAPTVRLMGHAFFKLKKYTEAIKLLRAVTSLAPDDKESLFALASCYYELNQADRALRIFTFIKDDPVVGAEACLFSGTIHSAQHSWEKAIGDFETGLSHDKIKNSVLLELKYRLASVLLRRGEIGRGVSLLNEVTAQDPVYKDAGLLISKYREMNANKNMQIYLLGAQAEFIALCRRIVLQSFSRSKVKITSVQMHSNEWADVVAEIDSPRWSDLVMFRFIRTQNSVGELTVRDFHSHIKEVKAGKGYCFSMGEFTEEARHYTEARLIDLIEKDKFLGILNILGA
jgi:tetratricopeptide (TPR) repeat protein